MSKYAIWNKTDNVYTPSGRKFTPAEWIAQYAYIDSPNAIPVVASGVLNGAFSGELNTLKAMAEQQGADFSTCKTNEEILAAIEAFEIKQNTPVVTTESTPEERIAAALEYNNLLNTTVVNTDDPDAT
jgi:hypothetical protein